MTSQPGHRIFADGPRSEIEIVLPEPGGGLSVSLSSSEPGGGQAERVGSWRFSDVGPGLLRICIDWERMDGDSVAVTSRGAGPANASGFELSPEAVLWPEMLLRVQSGGFLQEVPVKVIDSGLLADYYRRDSHQEQYVVQHPFFDEFHQGRLRCLGRIFREYIEPGSLVLDVGSGYSIFYMITQDWDFDITCCDLDSAAMEKMRGLAPRWDWVVADALELPFEDASYDALYAGEIIEHVPDPKEALFEWSRVLSDNGLLILSTPNRDRMLARANRQVMPVHHEHIREMNLEELRNAVSLAGFEILKTSGVYLEVLINWWRPPGRRVDLLTARLGHPRYHFLYRAAMRMGGVFPSRAFDLVVVCRKR